ncbi:MAG TPA: efflux RND transporter periplasmic adaptor subunit [Salinivirga sp.]|uniref:efflux RND transporter periplasmic adaptor subunit n=1 Tax=Salinivirga sp. TaxID=1970192 RepID=UPI002B461865|nr:efflux RND transporter periplasmic adaptor subunit [Salinivirga sp.]HKK58948.1 efflux RND transporter periplasmic adaptor subunit [Salinivirga sp.]
MSIQINKMLKSILFGVVSLVLFSCNPKTETITPEIKSITESVYSTGVIKSKNQYEVFAPVSGVIEKIFVLEGQKVKRGDSIFKIDNRNQKIATENARLNSVASDYANNKDKLDAAKKLVMLAKQIFINDSLLYQRQKNLWSQNIGSKREFEQAELKLERAKVELERELSNFEDVQRQLKLSSDQSKNNLKIAQIKEDNFIVKSELNGRIYKLNKEEGELTDGREPVAIIGADVFIIELSIDEKDIVKLNQDQQVIIRMDSYDEQVFEGRIVTIEPIMNKRTRSFQAEAVFTNQPPKLFPNLTVEANIVIQTKKEALTIPRNFLFNDSTVMLSNGEMQFVEVGLMDYEIVEILSGIDENTSIQRSEE